MYEWVDVCLCKCMVTYSHTLLFDIPTYIHLSYIHSLFKMDIAGILSTIINVFGLIAAAIVGLVAYLYFVKNIQSRDW